MFPRRRDTDEFGDEGMDEIGTPSTSRSGRPANFPSNRIRQSQRVLHELYSEGCIVEIDEDGPCQTCLVEFNNAVKKKFLVRFACFRVLG